MTAPRPDGPSGGSADSSAPAERRGRELEQGLASVRARVADAAAAAGRNPDDVTVVVVTKTFPPSDVLLLADLGVRDVGENRHPEARDKRGAVDRPGLRWHFIGRLQSNKARAVGAYADVVHSIDSAKVAERLGRGATDAGRTVECLVQVDLDPPGAHEGRGGVAPDALPALLAVVGSIDGLSLVGLMAVAPLGSAAAPAFERLREIQAAARSEFPAVRLLSAGMSEDLEAAVSAGATHVRIGRAILGSRPSLR